MTGAAPPWPSASSLPDGGGAIVRRRRGFGLSVLFAALAASVAGCAIPPGSHVDSMDSRAILAEFPDVARNCGLPEASLLRFTDEGRRFRLMLPASIYEGREAEPTAGRIGCITHWAGERGLSLIVQGSRR